MTFRLDDRLAADTIGLLEFGLCSVRLMRDAHYPWVILVPRRDGLIELTDLDPGDRYRLMDEIGIVADALKAETKCEKINVAAIGNIVRQLHVHIVARTPDDAAWPGPVWGRHPARPYAAEDEAALVTALRKRLM
jgi:diadenosine tetraphosphate (Ap4A) HIT family hydrolase